MMHRSRRPFMFLVPHVPNLVLLIQLLLYRRQTNQKYPLHFEYKSDMKLNCVIRVHLLFRTELCELTNLSKMKVSSFHISCARDNFCV